MKKVLILFIGLLSFSFTISQTPVSWNYSVSKIGDKTYELQITAIVDEPWHIYSTTQVKGGPLPTKISFNRNPLVELSGKLTEDGKIETKYEEVFEIETKYFSKKVRFVQVVKLKTNAKTSVSGTTEFMVCNDHACLPPKTIRFNIKLE